MCGIFGVVGVRKAAELTVIGLHSIQHRAQNSAGIVSSDGSRLYRRTGLGLALEFFTADKINALHGKDALGQIRYPTVTDDPSRDNTQPVFGKYRDTEIAIAHNGNLTNLDELREIVPDIMINTSLDTEFILRLLQMQSMNGGNIETDLSAVFALLEGSFALGILLPNLLIAIRDPTGNRPLSIGKLNGGYCISSETCAFPNVDAEYLCDVEPGTMVFIGPKGLRVIRFAEPREQKCRFEGVYFSHPASDTFGEGISRLRRNIGRMLGEAFPVPDADIITQIPDSSNAMAEGYAESNRSGLYFPVIYRNHRSDSAGRTFIAATQAGRDAKVARKFTFNATEIKGRAIVVVDDSIVRGTTAPKIIAKLRQLGAKAVHVRIGSPPVTHPCRYGINTPTFTELIAAFHSPEEIRQSIGADSLEFLPLEMLKQASPNPQSFCFACMTGEYW